MKYITAILIKFVLMTVVLWITLGLLFDVGIGDIILTSIVLTAVSFVVGDLVMLPKIGNIGSAMMDFALAAAGIWLLGSFLYDEPIDLVNAALVASTGVALGELLVHWYMKVRFMDGEATMPGYYDRELQTEFSEEIEPETKKNRDEE